MIKKGKEIFVTVKPKEYLQQGMRYCGGYTIKAILSAYGLDDGKTPKEYLPSLIKSLGFTTPKIIQRVLKKYGLSASIKRVNHLSDNKKLESIKKELDKNHPIILIVGNGYSPTGKYSSFRRQCISHYITIWGYNEEERIFYIYDSYVDKKSYDKIKIGNIKRSYLEILRDWKGSFYSRHRNFLFIPIISNNSPHGH